jgi:hypothetical protein
LWANITGPGSTMRSPIRLSVAQSVGLRYVLHIHDCDNAEEYRRRRALINSLIESGQLTGLKCYFRD